MGEGKENEFNEATKTSECFSDQANELKLHIQAMSDMLDCAVNENLNLWQTINEMEMQLEDMEDNKENNVLYDNLISMKRDYGIYRAERDEMRTDWRRLQAKYRSDQVRFLKEEEEATHVEMDREEFLRDLEAQILTYSKIKQLTDPNSVRKGPHFKMVDSLNLTVAELKKEKM